MSDCTFNTTTHPLVCRECRRPLDPRFTEPIRRRCDRPEPLTDEQIAERMLAAIAEKHCSDRPGPYILTLIQHCQTNECGLYLAGFGCTIGSECRRWLNWLERLAFGNCGHWDRGKRRPVDS